MKVNKAKMSANDTINGTFGAVWINGIKFANIKSFESKINYNWEQVDIAEDAGEHQRYMGYSGEGTMTFNKVDSSILDMLTEDTKAGKFPEITIIGKVEDSTGKQAERIQYNEVTVDSATLQKFEQKKLVEEEIPFKFASYELLDKIA